jgi:hypothetical protein
MIRNRSICYTGCNPVFPTDRAALNLLRRGPYRCLALIAFDKVRISLLFSNSEDLNGGLLFNRN